MLVRKTAQFSSSDLETEDENQLGPQTAFSWQPVADYFLVKGPFTGRSGPQVDVNSVLEHLLCFL